MLMALEPKTEYSLERSMQWQHMLNVFQVRLKYLSNGICPTAFMFVKQAHCDLARSLTHYRTSSNVLPNSLTHQHGHVRGLKDCAFPHPSSHAEVMIEL